jgi:response regulator RpfG family c-di-GMP phosphodiesterase
MEIKHSILYLDDEEQNLIAFQALLRKDYRVFTTTDAHEATEILSRENIAVIFSDQKMPDVSGVEFFENIIHEYPTPVRILLTGHADIEAVIDAINKGQVYRYVSKPWEVGDLKICIENAVEKFQRDADLLIKKSSLQQTQSEKAIATIFNYLYRWMTIRLTENSVPIDINSVLKKIDTQQQIVALQEIFAENALTSMHESRGSQNSQELLHNVIRSCDRIDPEKATIELINYHGAAHHCSESSKILAVILFTANLFSADYKLITPHIEAIENQEKSIGKIQLISTLNWSEDELRRIEEIVENLGIYINKKRGLMQLEYTTNNSIRITFESQHT